MWQDIAKDLEDVWDRDILKVLAEYIKIPCKSQAFTSDGDEHMDQAVALVADWCRKRQLRGMQVDVLRLPGRSPLLLIDVPGQGENTVLMYGHLDKQPEMHGWDSDKGPWQPVFAGDKLYGRGGADDGYAAFASLAALEALQKQGIPHSHCVVLIEASEESGSPDLPPYLEAYADRIGKPDLVVCLDSACGDYKRLWATSSLRGLLVGTLRLPLLREGIHSGAGGGVVPGWYESLQEVLARVVDFKGDVILQALQAEIPGQHFEHAQLAAPFLDFTADYPVLKPVESEALDLLLRQTWQPALALTGASGLPGIADAGNVCLPQVEFKLSFRLPPSCEAARAAASLEEVLCKPTSKGIVPEWSDVEVAGGWVAPDLAPWLAESMDMASREFFGENSAVVGTGMSIPFMGMLGKQFPEAQFLITGVLGPHSNAHGPNEFLHIPMVKRLNACISYILAKECGR